jgi:diguanylate cyclase (GGDEF)-like protein
VELDAIVHPERGRTWSCTIRDFCSEGMMLSGEERAGRSLRSTGFDPRRDDLIHIHFAVPRGESTLNFRLTARVARTLENGLGVYFPDNMPVRAFDALKGYADAGDAAVDQATDNAVEASGALSPEDGDRVRRRLRKLTAKGLPQLFKAFFERAEEELLIRARDAGSNELENKLYEAMRAVERGASSVAKDAGRTILAQIDEVSEKAPTPAHAQTDEREARLSLVDTDQFEDWLSVANVISRAENRYQYELLAITQRLGLVAKPWTRKDIVPVGPNVITVAFDEAMMQVDLDREIRQVIYGFFGDALLAFLRKFYEALMKHLEEAGVFPPLDAETMKHINRGPRSGSGAQAEAEPPEAQTAAEAAPEAGADGALSGVPPGAMPPGAMPPPPAAGAAQAAYQRTASLPMGNVYEAARELMRLQRGLPGPDGLPVEAPWSNEVRPAPELVYTRDEILAALDRLESLPPVAEGSGADRPSITQRLQSALEAQGGGKYFGLEQRDALEVVDGLVGTIRSDEYLPETVKSWLDGLEITLGKLATRNVEFLDTSATPLHPALELLNGLAQLGNTADGGEGMEPAVRTKVDEIVKRVTSDYDKDPEVFGRALEDLNPLLERQQRAFEGNLKRVVRQSEGSHRLVSARRSVVGALEGRLAGRAVPELLLKLLNPGWRNLLVHAHLRHGPESAEYQQHLDVVDTVLHALDEGGGDPEPILDAVSRGLEEISFEPGRRRPLLAALKAALEGQAEAKKVEVEPEAVAEALGLEDQLPETDPEPETEDEEERAGWKRWLERAREIKVGAWLSVDDDNSGRPRILTVAWIGEEHSTFTLVNRKGVKVHDYDLREMVSGLQDGRIAVLDEFDLPLMERAAQRMLQNMHNQLAFQATHDALTGLVNRKEFEKQVGQAVLKAEADGSDHVLMFVDLDQFKIINNTCGHDAGDDMLRSLVPRMRHELRGVRGTLARLGGDEFGVLLQRCTSKDGQDVARNLRTSVADYKFERDGREYSLTASVGFVAFSNDGRDAAMLLQQADAACYAAKDAGRNRVKVYEASDRDMAARRGVMEWVTEVDRILKEDRIQLTAQRIAPIRNAKGTPPHYEILMTVINADGKPIPPLDFITAAETYNRMPAVDRWVVKHSLDWMAKHMDRLDDIHGFSVNLSGASLNEEGFLDYIIRQLTLTRVPPDKVTFEVTETAAIGNMEAASRFINRLKGIGCRFSLDDFGTGLSSYSYLRNLPVDYVKIDGVFVKDLVRNPADYAVVKSVNEIAHFMGKQTIAEYVETGEILERLREIGVDFAQGFGIERPWPLDTFFDN